MISSCVSAKRVLAIGNTRQMKDIINTDIRKLGNN
jgi:hypothetical protein